MKEKMEWIEYSIEERHLLEKHLNELSKQGWNILGMTNEYLLLKEDHVEKEYIVDICENPNKNDPYKIGENTQKQIEMYEEFGYTFVCNYRNFLIFDSNGLEKNIHTDNEIEARLIEESKKKIKMRYMILPSIIEILVVLLACLFSKEILLLFLSSTDYWIFLAFLIIFNFNPLYIEFFMNRIKDENKPKFRVKFHNFHSILIVIFLGILAYEIFNSIVYLIALCLAGIGISYSSIYYTNKRLRGEMNSTNAKIGYHAIYILLIIFVSLSSDIKIEKNPMLLSENITGVVEEVEINMKKKSIFLETLDVTLTTQEDDYTYLYYKVKDTALNAFIKDLIFDKYDQVTPLYEIEDVKVVQIEKMMNYSLYEFKITKIGLIHDSEIIILSDKYKDNLEHLQKVVHELGW